MTHLFDLYMPADPAKALALAKELVAARPDGKTWPPLVAYADALAQAAQLTAGGKAAEAVRVLDSVKLPRLQNASPYYLAKAAAQDAAGDPQKAYETLLGQMGQSPADGLKAALVKAGAKLNKSESQVTGDLWALLESKAKPAAELNTTRFGDEKQVSLADYRGKVVLLNFWYPFCGPCRGEFPYLQAILDKYASKGLVIVSPNVHPKEDPLVLPYMQGMHWGFIPVHSDSDFAEKSYGARGSPANFLIDQQGRVVYKPGVIRGLDAQRTLELQIEAVLEHGGQEAQLDADRPAAAVATVEPASLPPGGHGTLKVALRLMEGGHANSNVPSDPNMVPTTFTPKAVEGITWSTARYPEPQTVREWYSTDPLSVFLNDSVITVPFTLDKAEPGRTITLIGVLFTQVCDHEQCYPPTRVAVTAEFHVTSGAKQ
jgi:thiol-disulfide isomerase/thioredoxin